MTLIPRSLPQRISSTEPFVLQRRSHQLRACDRLPVVADGDRSCTNHFSEFGQRLPLLADGDRTDRVDARRLGSLRLTNNESHGSLVVGHGVGVRHRAHRGESSGCRGPRSRRDRLDILTSGLAQMTVHIDETRRDYEPGAIDHVGFFGPFDRASHTDDFPVGDKNVADFVEILRRIDQRSSAKQDRLHSLSSRPRPLPPFAASASSGFPPASR